MNEKDIDNVLVFDIETTSKDPKVAVCKIWGCYSFKDKQFYYGSDKKTLQNLFYSHKFIVGHNIEDYDIPIVKRQYQLDVSKNKLIDTLILLRERDVSGKRKGKGRVQIIGEFRGGGLISNMPPSLGLADLIPHCYEIFKNTRYKHFFTEYKDEMDYDILKKDIIADKEWEKIQKYLEQDLIVTKNLYLFLEEYFDGFRLLLPKTAQDEKDYIISSTASMTYKIICSKLGLPIEFADKIEKKFPGAWVLSPLGEKFGPEDGDGICCDFASQHPHHEWSGNLFTPISKCKHKINGECPKPWSGGTMFKLKGKYCSCEMGMIEKLIRQFYFQRCFYKRKVLFLNGTMVKFKNIKLGDQYIFPNPNTLDFEIIYVNEEKLNEIKDLDKHGDDPREYTIKICINGTYGAASSSVFASIYNEFIGEDTTSMSRQSLDFMKDWMEKCGYKVVSGDTDSLYLFDPYHNKKGMLDYIQKGINKLKASLPFVDDSYGMAIDAEFTHIFFFTDSEIETEYKKKNYIYITKPDEKNPNGKLKVKGLGIIKRDCPRVAKVIVKKYLEQRILRDKKIKFMKEELQQLIEFEISENLSIIEQKINLKDISNYASRTSIQYQLASVYGAGTFYFIKNKKEGIGKDVKYMLSRDDKGNITPKAKLLKYKDLELDRVWSVLSPFIKKETKQMKLEF